MGQKFIAWDKKEINILKKYYAKRGGRGLVLLLPRRNAQTIMKKANDIGLSRAKNHWGEIEIVGKTFGCLTGVKKDGQDIYGRWKAIFLCGNCLKNKSMAIHMVVSGRTKTCGCHSRKDITGRRSGKLVAICDAGFSRFNERMWKCKCDCGNFCNIRRSRLIDKRVTSCGCGRSRQEKILSSDGYWLVYSPAHPNANKNGFVLEHRLVMSKFKNRALTSEEVVHHIDGDRQNNNIDNLQLCTKETHVPGQRVQERLRKSIEYIKKYAPELLKVEG